MIKVSGFSHKRGKKSYIRLAWMVLQNIYLMYRDIKNKEENNSVFILKICNNMNKPTK